MLTLTPSDRALIHGEFSTSLDYDAAADRLCEQLGLDGSVRELISALLEEAYEQGKVAGEHREAEGYEEEGS